MTTNKLIVVSVALTGDQIQTTEYKTQVRYIFCLLNRHRRPFCTHSDSPDCHTCSGVMTPSCRAVTIAPETSLGLRIVSRARRLRSLELLLLAAARGCAPVTSDGGCWSRLTVDSSCDGCWVVTLSFGDLLLRDEPRSRSNSESQPEQSHRRGDSDLQLRMSRDRAANPE